MQCGSVSWWVLVMATVCLGEKWKWPEAAQTVRIDTKVRFIDDDSRHDEHIGDRSSHDVPFEVPTDTQGFYNRPADAGRYPVRVQAHREPHSYHVDNNAVYPVQTSRKHNKQYDGTLDSLQTCRCVSTPDCKPHADSRAACGSDKYLCCYKSPNRVNYHNTEYFNEVEDERPLLLPGNENIGGPFPPPPNTELNGEFGPGHGHEAMLIGSIDGSRRRHPGILVGPQGPSGNIGPSPKPVLVGPGGPTGIIGPGEKNPAVLVGPSGPTGVIGPDDSHRDGPSQSASAQRGILVGPGGPTGIIGPYNQRPTLVGPGGPTGYIGPSRMPGILTGPGGPTGIIGPMGYRQRPGILVGPGGPTGTIGPGRQLLVGPGGPTGQIGPRNPYFGYGK